MVDERGHTRLEELIAKRQNDATKSQKNQSSVWNILKNNIGKELWKITMPVTFNEPLTFLQRLAEYMEYYELLIQASQESDPIKRLELVAAFAVSALSPNWQRTGKTFNPILGETFELDRLDECGYRFICEQVSHHPPVSAFHCEGAGGGFKFYGSVRPKIKFKCQSLEIQPIGLFTVEFSRFNSIYTWSNVTCVVNNIVFGKLWLDQSGCMEIVSHPGNLTCVLNFQASQSKTENRYIEGHISDKQNNKLKAIFGDWTTFLCSCNVDAMESYRSTLLGLKCGRKSLSFASFFKNQTNGADNVENGVENDDETVDCAGNCVVEDANGQKIKIEKIFRLIQNQPDRFKLLWKVYIRHVRCEEYYYFTNFAASLNEIDPKFVDRLPSTDSRFRPDVRLMESGDIDNSGLEKNRLEEKQRLCRKNSKSSDYTPLWFSKRSTTQDDDETWCFNNRYWVRNWADCQDIF